MLKDNAAFKQIINLKKIDQGYICGFVIQLLYYDLGIRANARKGYVFVLVPREVKGI